MMANDPETTELDPLQIIKRFFAGLIQHEIDTHRDAWPEATSSSDKMLMEAQIWTVIAQHAATRAKQLAQASQV